MTQEFKDLMTTFKEVGKILLVFALGALGLIFFLPTLGHSKRPFNAYGDRSSRRGDR